MPTNGRPIHENLMRRALQLARRGRDAVSPNPMVGAVVARGKRVMAEGWHRRCGGPHAEVEALRRAGKAARGADVYVTLEPCGHHGRTPPCAAALVDAGVARVIYAVRDPNPLTRGKGPRRLRAHGVSVVHGLLEDDARELNRPFFHWIETGTPWVILKWAMTLDGRIATAGGESQWITGEPARAHAHRLRRRVDAVIVGTETALRDDPRLDPRPARGRAPARVLVDRNGRLPASLKLLSGDPEVCGPGRRVYVTSAKVARARRRELEESGLEVLVVPSGRNGLRVPALCEALGERGISQLLVEGGAQLLGSFLTAGAAHEASVFIAPRIAGGDSAPGAVGGAGVRKLVDTPWLETPSVRRLGRDVVLEGRLVDE